MDDNTHHSLNIDDLTGNQQGQDNRGYASDQNPAPQYTPPTPPTGGLIDVPSQATPRPSAPSLNLHPNTTYSTNPPQQLSQSGAPQNNPADQQANSVKNRVMSAKRLGNQHKRKLRPIGYALGAFAVFLIVFNFQLIAQQIGYFLHPPKPADNLTLQDPNALTTNAQIVPPDSVIIIPKINVSAPIVYADSVAEDEVMKDLESGVVHYANTAKPGENGNAVIFGHSSNDWWEAGDYKFVFALLNKLEVGDQVQVNYSSRKYVYEVTEKKVVAPTEVSVLNQTPNPILTLITCTPPGTAWQRLIVVAKQIQPVPTTKPVDQVASAQKPATQAPQPQASAALPGNAPSIGDQLSDIWSDVVAFFRPQPASQDQPTNQQQGTPRLPEVS